MNKNEYNWNEYNKNSLDKNNIEEYNLTPNTPIYKVRQDLNSKIYIINKKLLTITECEYFGNLDVLILQIPKKHLITKPSDYRINIIQRCGEEIFNELIKNPILSPGECILTSSFKLHNVKYLIHSALPKFSFNYSEASYSALHLSIRNSLDICIENNYKNIIFGKDIFQPTENFPLNEATEVIIRTLRKVLENFGEYFSNIIIAIDDENIFNTIIFYMKIFFPRNKEEENKYKKYIKPLQTTNFGDLILPQRSIKINKFIKEKDLRNFNFKNNDLIGFDFEEGNNDYINDKIRIGEVFKEEIDFAKKFYYLNNKEYNESLETYFDDLNCLQFKGTDINKRQIFFLYLKLINFNKLEDYQLENDFLLYCYQYFKNNFQNGKNLSLIILCKDIDKINYPPKGIIETVQKMLLSISTLNAISDIKNIQICFLLPDFLFKCYYQVIKIFIKNTIIDQIKIYESYEEFNEDYFLDLDNELEKRINNTLSRITDKYEEIYDKKKEKENIEKYSKTRFKENYFLSKKKSNL